MSMFKNYRMRSLRKSQKKRRRKWRDINYRRELKKTLVCIIQSKSRRN
jgi:hypothetical protein